MKRFLTLAALLFCAIPVGLSVGCSVNPNSYCPGSGNVVSINSPTQIILQPQFGAVSIAYGQIRALATPKVTNCLGNTITAPGGLTYGSSNPNLLDISPTGNMCAGTWRRNVGGTTTDYTICDPPAASAIPSTQGASYSDVTVSSASVTSNVVPVFVHPQASVATLYPAVTNSDGTYTCTPTTTCGGASTGLNSCLSQNQTQAYCAQVCAGDVDISDSVGTVTFATQNTSIATFNSSIFANAGNTGALFGPPVTLAKGGSPGASTLSINASNTTVDAGLFATCSPAYIALQQATTGNTSFTLPLNNTQSLVASVYDTNNMLMSSVPLQFVTNSPQTYSLTASGQVTSVLGGSGDVYAVCLPPACNPAPSTSDIGLFGGVGQPLTSNAVSINTPTTTASVVYAVSYSSPTVGVYNTQLSGTAPSTIRLPYTPNSAVIRQDGGLIVLGSNGTAGINAQLMFVSTATNTLAGYDNTVTGKVLAISPNGAQLVFSNADQGLIYLYAIPSSITSNSTGGYITFGGVGEKAHYTPDGNTIYIEGYKTVNGQQQPTEFVFDVSKGLTQYAEPAPLTDVAVLTPAVGAFYSSTANTTALGYCAATTPTVQPFAPSPDLATAPNDALFASLDGQHVFGASAASAVFNDIAVVIPTDNPSSVISGAPDINVPQPCSGGGYAISGNDQAYPLPVPAGSDITYVQATPDSTAAVVTYTGNGNGTLPAYVIGNPDVPQTVPLAGSATTPVSAVASTDNSTFFVSTAGDGQIHTISVAALKNCAAGSTTCAADTAQVPTGIVDANNNPLPADVLLVRAIRPLQ